MSIRRIEYRICRVGIVFFVSCSFIGIINYIAAALLFYKSIKILTFISTNYNTVLQKKTIATRTSLKV